MSQPQSQAAATTMHPTQSTSNSNQPHSRGESASTKRSPSPQQVTPRSSQKSLPPHPKETNLSAAKTFTTVDEDGIEHIHHASPDHTNVHTECGRHGDDWLFGGWNLGQVIKGLIWGGRK
ncbi:hypothetical protein V8E51_013195 [Hyaloscypha variabilis]|uniref:Uncharacterized protein n=1 Tax=Hyaloscypha variabilis (strain UAMH 11265 / GT02V1 / F) TaxID=1149755 RepID=A0A2J6RGH9_HYAVF|nr:hypothetical protein L207DRAFT_514852 [Hyaloscypha variabilis F]